MNNIMENFGVNVRGNIDQQMIQDAVVSVKHAEEAIHLEKIW